MQYRAKIQAYTLPGHTHKHPALESNESLSHHTGGFIIKVLNRRSEATYPVAHYRAYSTAPDGSVKYLGAFENGRDPMLPGWFGAIDAVRRGTVSCDAPTLILDEWGNPWGE